METYISKWKYISANGNILQQMETYCSKWKHIAANGNILQQMKTCSSSIWKPVVVEYGNLQ